jgi:hypothetical protein
VPPALGASGVCAHLRADLDNSGWVPADATNNANDEKPRDFRLDLQQVPGVACGI